MTLKEDLTEELKKNRPNLSAKSVITYVSTLANIPKKIAEGDAEVDVRWYAKNTGKILKAMGDVSPNKRKSVLSALFILTGDKDIHKVMLEDVKTVNENYKKQTKSASQKENWIEWEDVLIKHGQMEQHARALFKKKHLTPQDMDELCDFVLLSCYVLFPVRRLMDYGHMKIRNWDEAEDNFIHGSKMTFNIYKTKKIYGRQSFKIEKDFATLIKKWAKINETDYLILTKNNKPTASSALNSKLNSIFGKKISANILRHSFLTYFYSGQMPTYTEMETMSQKMGHSIDTALQYIKRDDVGSDSD